MLRRSVYAGAISVHLVPFSNKICGTQCVHDYEPRALGRRQYMSIIGIQVRSISQLALMHYGPKLNHNIYVKASSQRKALVLCDIIDASAARM